MELISKISINHYNYFMNANPLCWASCYCQLPNYCYTTSSVAESYNSMILKFRGRSYCELIICIRDQQIEKHVKNTASIIGSMIHKEEFDIKKKFLLETVKNDNQRISEFASGLLSRLLKECKLFTFSTVKMYEYKVIANLQTYRVEIYADSYCCTCKFNLQMEFPCVHVLFVCMEEGINYYNYISKYFSLFYYYMIYLSQYTFIDYEKIQILQTSNSYNQIKSDKGAIKRKRFNSKNFRKNKYLIHSRSWPDDENDIIEEMDNANVFCLGFLNIRTILFIYPLYEVLEEQTTAPYTYNTNKYY